MLAADEIQQVRAGLWFWQRFQPSVKVDCSSCAVRVAAGLMLVDPIPLAADAMEELCALGKIAGIVATNGNHGRAVDELRKRFDVPVFAHASAGVVLGFPVDREVREGERIGDEIEVVEIAGAAAGEIALWDARGVMIVGDALINLEPDGLVLLPAKYADNEKEMRASLRKLLRFPIEVLTFAHGLPLVSQARSRLKSLLA